MRLLCKTVEEWQALKTKTIELKKTEFADRLHEVDDKLKHDYAKVEQKILEHNSNLKNSISCDWNKQNNRLVADFLIIVKLLLPSIRHGWRVFY